MALTSSIARIINQGVDQLITENHVDSAGQIHVWTYSAPLNADTTALLAAHKTQLENDLAEAEAEAIVNG
ncbi:MAG: hypothetical protein IPO40_25040 [Fibrobacteres bacterium]|nr:hypothetical protein [Fibrobacterota bacterium]